jgi:tRNA1Val (adenine37-N6)-methyltransferase
MRAAGIEPKRLRMVHSFAASAASVVLVEGVKGGRSEAAVEAPLIVYDAERRYSTEAAAILSSGSNPI